MKKPYTFRLGDYTSEQLNQIAKRLAERDSSNYYRVSASRTKALEFAISYAFRNYFEEKQCPPSTTPPSKAKSGKRRTR